MRKKVILRDGSPAEQVAALVEHLKKDGHDFTVGIPLDTPIAQAERVVSAGKGIGGKKNMKLIEDLAKAAGAQDQKFRHAVPPMVKMPRPVRARCRILSSSARARCCRP